MDIGGAGVSLAAVGFGDTEVNTAVLALLAILVGNGFILAASLPARDRLPPLLVGIFVLSIGTTIPELAIVIRAALGDVRLPEALSSSAASIDNYKWLTSRTFPIAVVIGSCLANLLLVTGVAGLVLPKPFKIERFTRGRDLSFLLIAIIVLALGFQFREYFSESGAPGTLRPIWLGFALVGLGVIYVIVVGVTELTNGDGPSGDESPDGGADIVSTLFYFALGAILLVLGVHLIFLESSSVVEILFKGSINMKAWPIEPADVSKYARYGLLFIGLAVALPELLATLFASLRGQSDVVAGNLMGASVFNLLGVLGIGIILSNGRMVTGLDLSIFLPDLILLFVGWALLLLFFRTESQLAAWEGFVLFALYIGYWICRYTEVIPPYFGAGAGLEAGAYPG